MKRLPFVLLILTSLILITVIILGFRVINKKNAEIKNLKSEIKNNYEEISQLKEDNKKLEMNIPEPHQIDKAVQECMKQENYTTYAMSKCVDDSVDDWNKIIDKNIKSLKKTLPQDSYKLLMVSQNKWNEYRQAQINLNNKTVACKIGTMYINITSGLNADIVEERAKDLEYLNQLMTNME